MLTMVIVYGARLLALLMLAAALQECGEGGGGGGGDKRSGTGWCIYENVETGERVREYPNGDGTSCPGADPGWRYVMGP